MRHLRVLYMSLALTVLHVDCLTCDCLQRTALDGHGARRAQPARQRLLPPQREQLKTFQRLLPESQGQNLALTGLYEK